MSARDDILSAIRRRQRRGPADAAALQPRLDKPRRNLVPARGLLSPADRLALFERMAAEQAATVARVSSLAAAPSAVVDFLEARRLAGPVRVAPSLAGLDWTALRAVPGKATPTDAVSVTLAFAGVAETGTAVLLSGADDPTSLNFLPDTHVIVVHAGDVLGCYEDVWDRLRARGAAMPRTVNLITGPSRTGDIEQTIQLGAHGPRRLHLIIVDGRDGA